MSKMHVLYAYCMGICVTENGHEGECGIAILLYSPDFRASNGWVISMISLQILASISS